MAARINDPLLDLPDWMEEGIVRNKRFGKSDLIIGYGRQSPICCAKCWVEVVPSTLSVTTFTDTKYYCSSKCLRSSRTDYSVIHNINYDVHVRYVSHTVHLLSRFYLEKTAPMHINTYYPRVAPIILPPQ